MSGNTVPTVWFENEAGAKWYPPTDGDMPPPPDGFRYMHARNPLELTDYIYNDNVQIMAGHQTYPAALVLAMTRPSLLERWRTFSRTGRFPTTYPLDEAVIRAATSCERCLNVMLYEHGCMDGYAHQSVEWWGCFTECEYCRLQIHPRRHLSKESQLVPAVTGEPVSTDGRPDGP